MSEPQDDKIVWAHNAPERSSIKSFTKKELADELCKREGVKVFTIQTDQSHQIRKCVADDTSIQWFDVDFSDGAVTILVIK